MKRRWPLWVVLALGLALLYLPLAGVALQSFNDNPKGWQWRGFTLRWYAALFGDAEPQHRDLVDKIWAASWVSVKIALLSTGIATLLGTTLAIGLQRTPLPRWLRRGTDLITGLPVVTPDIILAIALVGAFEGLRRWCLPWFTPGLATLVVAHVTFQIPFVAVVVAARLAMIKHDQIEAARDLYASSIVLWTRILLPQLMPGIIAGALLAFVLSIDDFVISFFVYSPQSTPLPIIIYGSAKRGISPVINALSTVVVALTALAIIVAAWLSRPRPTQEHP